MTALVVDEYPILNKLNLYLKTIKIYKTFGACFSRYTVLETHGQQLDHVWWTSSSRWSFANKASFILAIELSVKGTAHSVQRTKTEKEISLSGGISP